MLYRPTLSATLSFPDGRGFVVQRKAQGTGERGTEEGGGDPRSGVGVVEISSADFALVCCAIVHQLV